MFLKKFQKCSCIFLFFKLFVWFLFEIRSCNKISLTIFGSLTRWNFADFRAQIPLTKFASGAEFSTEQESSRPLEFHCHSLLSLPLSFFSFLPSHFSCQILYFCPNRPERKSKKPILLTKSKKLVHRLKKAKYLFWLK